MKKERTKTNLWAFKTISISFLAIIKAAIIITAPIITTGEVLKRETNLLTAVRIQKSKKSIRC
jgi:hypothetical protein